MTYPNEVLGYTLVNEDKVRRALEGNPGRGGELVGGIIKADGTWDDAQLLAMYDKMGGAIYKGSDKVETGSFYDFRKKAPKEKAEVIFEFRINGQLVRQPADEEVPMVVKAARTMEKMAKEAVKKKK